MDLAEVQQELREYIHRYKARHGIRPLAMPVTPTEAAEMLVNSPLAGAFRAEMDPEAPLQLSDRVMDFEGVELFVLTNARTARRCGYPNPLR